MNIHAVSRPLLGWLDGLILAVLLLAVGLLIAAGQRTRSGGTALDLGQAAIPLALFLVVPLAWPVRPGHPVDVVLNTLITGVACIGALWIMASRSTGGGALSALGFHRISPRDGWMAVFMGLFLAIGAVMAMPFYSGGQSEMTEMIKLTSGIMSLASLGLVSVWTEELLLRGAIYGACQKRWGPVVAILASAAVFSVLHVAQHWGNLSAWAVVSITGLGLSLVRFATGSTLASTLAHLSYNLILIAPSVVLAG